MTEKIKNLKSGLGEGEMVIKASGGGPISFVSGAKGGYLYLTNKKIIHETIFGKRTMEIDIQNIGEVMVGTYSMLLMILPIMKCVHIYMKTPGVKYKLNVTDKIGWMMAIKETMKA